MNFPRGSMGLPVPSTLFRERTVLRCGGLAPSGVHSGIIVCGRLDPCLPPSLAPRLCQFPRGAYLSPKSKGNPVLVGRVQSVRGPKWTDMGTVIPFSESHELAMTERCLAQADRCILRQLHLISYIDRRSATHSLAANTLKHMVIAHHLLKKYREQLEHELAGPRAS